MHEGRLALEVGGTTYRLDAGHAAIASTDRPHAYACAGTRTVRFTMVVAELHPRRAAPDAAPASHRRATKTPRRIS